MGDFALDGLGGFPTAAIVDKLMNLERRPAFVMQKQQQGIKKEITALQGLNAKISSALSNALGVVGKSSYNTTIVESDKVWKAATGKSDNPTVRVDAKSGAQTSSLEFEVSSVASNKVVKLSSADMPAENPPTISVLVGNKIANISPASGSLQDIAKAINSAKDLGVSATAVRVGDNKYILQVTGKDTGEIAGDFKIFAGDAATSVLAAAGGESNLEKPADKYTAAGVDGGTSTATVYTFKKEVLTETNGQHKSNILAAAGGDSAKINGEIIKASKDAKIKLWSDSATSSVEVTSSSNTFKNLVDNVDVTIGIDAKNAQGDAVSPIGKAKIETSEDATVPSSKVKNLVSSLGIVLQEFNEGFKSSTTKGADGKSVLSPGVLATNPLTRILRDEFSNVINFAPTVDGKQTTLEEIGISVVGAGKGGDISLSFDESKFAAAMEKDPSRVEQIASSFAKKVEEFAVKATKVSYYDSDNKPVGAGVLSDVILARQGDERRIGDRITQFDYRLEKRKLMLEKQFNGLQTALANFQSQGQWLAGQLAALPKMQ